MYCIINYFLLISSVFFVYGQNGPVYTNYELFSMFGRQSESALKIYLAIKVNNTIYFNYSNFGRKLNLFSDKCV